MKLLKYINLLVSIINKFMASSPWFLNFISNHFNTKFILESNRLTILYKLIMILNIDTSIYLKGINDQKVKDELKKLTSEAYNKEIFGAPTFIYRDKIFWGQDRLEYAIDEFLN